MQTTFGSKKNFTHITINHSFIATTQNSKIILAQCQKSNQGRLFILMIFSKSLIFLQSFFLPKFDFQIEHFRFGALCKKCIGHRTLDKETLIFSDCDLDLCRGDRHDGLFRKNLQTALSHKNWKMGFQA